MAHLGFGTRTARLSALKRGSKTIHLAEIETVNVFTWIESPRPAKKTLCGIEGGLETDSGGTCKKCLKIANMRRIKKSIANIEIKGW